MNTYKITFFTYGLARVELHEANSIQEVLYKVNQQDIIKIELVGSTATLDCTSQGA